MFETLIDYELIAVLREIRNETLVVPARPSMARSVRYYRHTKGEYDIIFLGLTIPKNRKYLLETLAPDVFDYDEIKNNKQKAFEAIRMIEKAWLPAVFRAASELTFESFPRSGYFKDVDEWLSKIEQQQGIHAQIRALAAGVPEEDVFG